jgi:hypothetical protein
MGSSQRANLIDHRFFFYREKDRCGDYTCGLARKAVADALFHHQEYFSDANFLELLPRLINNPSTTGFFMEYGVLFYLQLNGIPGHTYLGQKMKVVSFNNDIPQFQKDIIGKPVIYHPLKFNYETVDGIIVYIMKDDDVRMTVAPPAPAPAPAPTPAPAEEGSKVAKKNGKNKTRKGTKMAAVAAAAVSKIGKKTREDTEMAMESNLGDQPKQKRQLLLCPYQVTINRKSHSDSHAKFFKEYDMWVKDLQEFDVVTEFIWFTDGSSPDIVHPASDEYKSLKSGNTRYNEKSPKWPEHQELFIGFSELNKVLGEKYNRALKLKEEPGNQQAHAQVSREQG